MVTSFLFLERNANVLSCSLNEFKTTASLIQIYGLMSSHPAACLAAAKAFGNGIGTVRLDFIRKHAAAVMKHLQSVMSKTPIYVVVSLILGGQTVLFRRYIPTFSLITPNHLRHLRGCEMGWIGLSENCLTVMSSSSSLKSGAVIGRDLGRLHGLKPPPR